MVTTAALTEADVLLVGMLHQHRRGSIPGRPSLQIVVFCPVCKGSHHLPWPDEFRLDAAELVDAPCSGGPWKGSRIAVGLDPARMAEHGRAAADFAARLRRWKVEARLRHLTAVERSKERAYRREGWDVDA